MRLRALLLAYCAGTLLVQGLPALPGRTASAILLALAAASACRRTLAARCLAVALAAFVLTCLRVGAALEERVPASLEGEAIRIRGRVQDLPRRDDDVTTFVLSGATALRARWPDGRQTLRLHARGDFHPGAGMVCTVHVRLRQPRGLRSAGAFDAEQWYFAAGIDATGHVVAHPSNACHDDARGALGRLRERLARAIARHVEAPAEASILAALAVGARTDIVDHQWNVLRDTGIVHLISVSGLHVGMLSLGVYWLVTRAAVAVAVMRRRPAGHALPIVLALAVAVGYAVLSGFSVPTQRTVLMIAVALTNRLRAAPMMSLDSMLLTFTVVLACSPLAALGVSFWLSFGALALLLLIHWLRRGTHWRRPWVTVHGWMLLLLAPLLATMFQSVPVAAPFANLVAVPLVTWVTVPLSLVGCLVEAVSDGAGAMFWHAAAWTWRVLWLGLEVLDAGVPALVLPFAPPVVLGGLGTLVAALLLLPLRAPRRVLLPSILGLFLCGPVAPLRPAEFRIDVLDVGQGLAVVVRTARHTLLYDSGTRYPSGGDIGRDIVLPFLRQAGVHHLDRLIVSHGDIDHAGGAASVVAAFAPDAIQSGEPMRLRRLGVAGATRCRAGQRWRWDGVGFEILHPTPTLPVRGNDRSCVLRIESRHGAVLLPGDLTRLGETALLARGTTLAAALLIVPHHGSATSSSAALIGAVAPRIAVVSAGYLNRFGHPHPAVLARYVARGIDVVSTVETGTYGVTFGADGLRQEATRQRSRRYWDPMPAAPFPAR